MPLVRLAEILGQPDVEKFLRGVVASRRYSNAYLFHGPPGVGKGTAALAFARAILCDRVVPADDSAPSLFDAAPAPARDDAPADDACGRCNACAKSATLQHPDLKFLFPVSGEERELDETVMNTIAAVREDPLFVFGYDKAASIRLSITRDLLRELAFKPFEAERRVVVVRDADRMREDQYSALLKTVEEPGAATVWVLTTARASRLPATIRSRCQKVRFLPLPEAEVIAFLETRAGVGTAAARMLAALSGGSLARSLALRDQDPVALRNQALALVDPAQRGDAAGLLKAVQGLTKFGKAGRETLRLMIEFQELWQRDLLRARYGATRDELVNRDVESRLRREAEQVDATEIRRRLMVLEEALRAIEGNVTPELALFSAVSRLASPGRTQAVWPAHAAARWQY